MGRLDWRTRVEEVAPARVTVAQSGRVRVWVRGSAVGYVECDGKRHYVFGQFVRSFLVRTAAPVSLSVVGLFGREHREVRFKPHHDVAAVRFNVAAAERLRCVAAPPTVRGGRVPKTHCRIPQTRITVPRADLSPAPWPSPGQPR